MQFFDLHCDTAYRCFKEGLHLGDERLAVTPKKAQGLSDWHQCFAVFISDETENPFSIYKAMLEGFKAELADKPPFLTPYFTLEGASLIDSSEKVEVLKHDGIRAVALTWNGENQIAGGAKSDKGLTDFGKSVIKALNKNKIFTDLSHLNEKSFYKAVEIAEYPIATHSDCRALCDNKRNLYDKQIELIAEKGGIIGLCFYPEFLRGDAIGGIYQNICHLLYKGYEDNIAIGSDFDGGVMAENLDGIDKIPKLFEYLEKKGLEKSILNKIFYTNALKCFDKTKPLI